MIFERRNNYFTFCYAGWQAGGFHSWCISLPECRVASRGLGKVQYYSTSGNDKDGPSKASSDAPTAEKVLSAATPASSGDQCVINVWVFFARCVKLSCALFSVVLIQALGNMSGWFGCCGKVRLPEELWFGLSH